MKRAFVTGGTGFIGSHLAEELLRRGYDEVRCLIRSERKWLDGINIVEVRADLLDEDAVAEAVADVDFVYHVAGLTRAKSWKEFERSNVEATMRLMDVVSTVNPSVEKVLVMSSLAVVGPCRGGVATEESSLEPISQYGRSKALMERRLDAHDGNLPITVIRPPTVYGPRERDVFAFFRMLSKGICPVVGDITEPALSLVHVADLVRGMVDAAESVETTHETYFLGSEPFYSWSDIKDAATEALGRKALTVAVPPFLVRPVGAAVELAGRFTGTYPPLNREKAREIRFVCKKCCTKKAKRDFGYEQRVPLGRGIGETIAWYRDEGWI